MNKRAIITGASSGIGKALAFEFAKNNYDLLLTARDETALRGVARECEDRYGIETEVFVADLADADSIGKLIEKISDSKFEILVNNAGFGVKGDFVETEIASELEMLDVQLAAMLKLTKTVLPQMIAGKSGKILNVASVYSFSPVPKQSVYSACKAFMLSFSSALRNEIAGSGVSISVLCPGVTQTEFRTRAGIIDKKNSGMTAEKVAQIAYAEMIGGKFVIVPGVQNKVFAFLSKHLPESARSALIKSINNKRGVNRKN